MPSISALFLDVGGVLLTNGWDRRMRQAAAGKFGLDYDEMNERHHLTYDTYESGKLTLDTYLDRVVFYEKRSFTHGDFKEFMFDQSKPLPHMLDYLRALKEKYNLKITVVNNEGREVNEYRIHRFNLSTLVDAFVSSCFVHFRKPDTDIFRVALDVTQVSPERVAYLDDRLMFVTVANTLGIKGIHHRNYESTKNVLDGFGLTL